MCFDENKYFMFGCHAVVALGEVTYFWQELLIAYSIFSLYRNTKTIHSIMMIWLVNFIVSNYKLASGPPKDPGGVKNIFSKSKDIDS